MRYRIRIIAVLTVLAIHSPASADNAVTRWVEHALQTVRAQNIGTAPAARVYAMATIAMYDAVNGIDRARRLSAREHAIVPPDGAPALGDRRAAAAAAAHAVLKSFVPAGSAQALALDTALAQELESLSFGDPQLIPLGQSWGAAVGQAVVSNRSNDGTQVAQIQPPGTGPGEYRTPFTGAQFRNMAAFGVRDLTKYGSPGPPELASEQYAVAFNEIKAHGDVNDPDPERAAIARHWQAEANTARETGLWLKAALEIVERRGTVHSLSRTARLFALLGMAVGDAVASAWSAKYDAHFWRPGDAIREAGSDGNPDTEPDPAWTPRNITFGNSPEYPSGTSTFAGASSTVLAGFYCTDRVAFDFEGEQGTRRDYRRLSDAADEAGVSRIYNGLHFRFSKEAGLSAGRGIGREIVTTRLRRTERCTGNSCACPQ